MGLFDKVQDIASWKKINKTSDFPPFVKEELLYCENIGEVAQETIDWLNGLIVEYNSKAKKKAGYKHEQILYNAIKECLNFIPFQSQPIALINLCILSDDARNKKLHDTYFKVNLQTANERVNTILDSQSDGQAIEIDHNALSALGFLNFKAHEYKEAIRYLTESTEMLSKIMPKEPVKEDYNLSFVTSKIHLASCYEYDISSNDTSVMYNGSDFSSYENRKAALSSAMYQLLGNKASELEKIVSEEGDGISEQIVEQYQKPLQKCSLDIIKSIVKKLVNDSCRTFDIFKMESKGDERVFELQNEYIHVLAHCISEYAAVIRDRERVIGEDEVSTYPLCSFLQMISRFLLDWLVAKENKKYVTCQATVRTENDATPEAIDLLLKQVNSNDISEDDKAELQFFIYYFAEQELRLAYDDKELIKVFNDYRENFLEYAKKVSEECGNFDSLFHYHIVYFRYLLKKSAYTIISYPDNHAEVTYGTINRAYEELVYSHRRISRHVLQPVRDEFERLKILYLLYRQIKDLKNDNTFLTEIESNEFIQILQHLGIDYNKIGYTTVLSRIYNQIVAPRNILLLAPVRNAPSCSFSEGNVGKLLSFPAAKEIAQKKLNCRSFIEQQTAKDNSSIVSDKSYRKISNLGQKEFKWAIYIQPDKVSGEVLLFYNDFFKEDKDNKMFPIILGDLERKRFWEIVDKLFEANGNTRNPCSSRSDLCKSKRLRVCHYHAHSISDGLIKKYIMELLVFLEFDFLKYEHFSSQYASRIDNNDVVVFYRQKSEYQITSYAEFDDRVKLCECCEFEPYDPTDDISAEGNEKPINNKEYVTSGNSESCKRVRFNEARSQLESRIKELTEKSAHFRDVSSVIVQLDNCRTSVKCPYPEERTSSNCKLIELLLEYNVLNFYGEGIT